MMSEKRICAISTPQSVEPNCFFPNSDISTIKDSNSMSSVPSKKTLSIPLSAPRIAWRKESEREKFLSQTSGKEKKLFVSQNCKRKVLEKYDHEDNTRSTSSPKDNYGLLSRTIKVRKIFTKIDKSGDEQKTVIQSSSRDIKIGQPRKGTEVNDFIDEVRHEKLVSPKLIRDQRLSGNLQLIDLPREKLNTNLELPYMPVKSVFNSPFDGTVRKGIRKYIKAPAAVVEKKSDISQNIYYRHLYATSSIDEQISENIMWSKLTGRSLREISASPSPQKKKKKNVN